MRINIFATFLVLIGVVLHTYVAVAKSHSFDAGFWLLALLPYIVGSILLTGLRKPYATVGALLIPVAMDIATFYYVFISPSSSTAPLALFFVPLWNLFFFVPFGGAVGWFIGKRIDDKEKNITKE